MSRTKHRKKCFEEQFLIRVKAVTSNATYRFPESQSIVTSLYYVYMHISNVYDLYIYTYSL